MNPETSTQWKTSIKQKRVVSVLQKTILTLFLCISISSFSQDCSILKNNKFTYKLAGKDVEVEFKENEHFEYHQKRKYYIKSTIEWISDCEYYLIIQEVTLPNFPFSVGSRLHIKVTKVRHKKVYYRSKKGARTWEGKMTLSE